MSGIHRRGFASMDPERRRAIAGRGGRAAHALGKAHKFSPEEASEAGKIGGRVISRDRRHMAELGRKGGEARRSSQEVAGATEAAPTPVDMGGQSQDGPAAGSSGAAPLAGGLHHGRSLPPVPKAPHPGKKCEDAGSVLILLENGPFGGCSIRLDTATGVPCELRFDLGGVVIDLTADRGGDPSAGLGRTVEPVPILELADEFEHSFEFVYARGHGEERGYDGVLRFVDMLLRMPHADVPVA